MGIIHLISLRNFLKKNKDKGYNKTYLRDQLKQNYSTIQDNLSYLVDIEKVVKLTSGKYRWDTKNELLAKKSRKT